MFTALYKAGWGWDELKDTYFVLVCLAGLLLTGGRWAIRIVLLLSVTGLSFWIGQQLVSEANQAHFEAYKVRVACLATCGCPFPMSVDHSDPPTECPETHWCRKACESIDFQREKPNLHLTLISYSSPVLVLCGAALRLALDDLWALWRRRRRYKEQLRTDSET